MRRLLESGITAALLVGAAHGQVLGEWQLSGQPGDQSATAATNSAAGLVGLPLVRGAGVNPSAAANSFSATGWHDLGAQDYFAFGFTVEPGSEVNLGQLLIATRSSNTGPANCGLFYSGDGFATNLFTFVQSGTATTLSLVDLSGLTGLSGTVEFRVRALDTVSAGGGTVSSAGAFRFADPTLGGSTVPVRLTGAVVPAGSFAVPFCTGDGGGGACPCGNAGAAGQGCANSAGQGARLWGGGTASVSAGNLVLWTTGLVPGQPGLYFQGNLLENAGQGTTFGDGLRCTGPAGVHLETVFASAAGTSATGGNLALAGGVAVGQTRSYQVWYRDPGSSPCGSGFNASNGLAITWVP